MKIIASASEMSTLSAQLRAEGRTIALVPTMGALHTGKTGLIRAAAERADVVIVVIFVNPFQFGPSESIASYPRSLHEDEALCEQAGAHIVFAPPVEEVFPTGYSTFVTEDVLAKPLCGGSRPTHFRGVATLMVKLFNLTRPNLVFFGQKTAQRAAVVRKVAEDLAFGVEVVVVPTVREHDGLAAGVRNSGLTGNQRQGALAFSQALRRAKEMADSGVRSPDRLIAEVTHILSQHRSVRVIYVSIVDRQSMEAVREVVPGETLLAIAAWINEVRFIDNAIL
jgi:pantoate--beta-alanine ligase